MISVETALQRLLALLVPVGAEQVTLPQAVGRVLAEDVAARRTQPPFDASAMDGYAVRAADVAAVPARLRVIGAVPAGQSFQGTVGAGEAVRIFTGAPVPAGADGIVIQEDADRDGDHVVVREGVGPGRFVRRAGLDFMTGDVLLRAGRVLTVRDVGLAAAMNRPWLLVHRKPRVAILSTGDEIVLPGDPIGPAQIVSSNGIALTAFVESGGGSASMLAVAGDDAGSLRRLAAQAAGADLIVTTGGASVGEHDLIREALTEDGLDLDFWKIAMRPGKPLMVGRLRGTPLLGLPGNPVSTLVCSHLFLAPALDRLLGLPDKPRGHERAALARPLAANDGRQDYLRARLMPDGVGGTLADVFDRQDSSMMAPLAHADGLVVRPPHAPAAAAGESVAIIRFLPPF